MQSVNINTGQAVEMQLTLANIGGSTAYPMINAFLGNGSIHFADSTGNTLPVLTIAPGASQSITLTTPAITGQGSYDVWLLITDEKTGTTYLSATEEGTVSATAQTTTTTTSSSTTSTTTSTSNPALASCAPQIVQTAATSTSVTLAIQSCSAPNIAYYRYFHTDQYGNIYSDLGTTSNGVITVSGLGCGAQGYAPYHVKAIAFDAYGNMSQYGPVYMAYTLCP